MTNFSKRFQPLKTLIHDLPFTLKFYIFDSFFFYVISVIESWSICQVYQCSFLTLGKRKERRFPSNWICSKISWLNGNILGQFIHLHWRFCVHSVNILTMNISLIQVLFETQNLGTEWNKLIPNKWWNKTISKEKENTSKTDSTSTLQKPTWKANTDEAMSITPLMIY